MFNLFLPSALEGGDKKKGGSDQEKVQVQVANFHFISREGTHHDEKKDRFIVFIGYFDFL
jgi:hypothetical protein